MSEIVNPPNFLKDYQAYQLDILPLLQTGNGKYPVSHNSHLFPVTFSLHVQVPFKSHPMDSDPEILHSQAKHWLPLTLSALNTYGFT